MTVSHRGFNLRALFQLNRCRFIFLAGRTSVHGGIFLWHPSILTRDRGELVEYRISFWE